MATIRDGDKSVLLVVDAQVGVLAGTWQEKEVTHKISLAVEKARQAGIPIIWVQHTGGELKPGNPEWAWVPELVPAEDEIQLQKRFNSAFEESDLEKHLAALGASHIVLAGAATNWCIRTTAYGALEHGYDLTLIKDGHTTSTDEDDEGVQIDAETVIHDLNMVMEWLRYPGRSTAVIAANDLDFSTPKTN